MRRLLFSAVSFLAITSGAMAADVEQFAPDYSWSGFYVGAVVGAGLFNSTFDDQWCTFSCSGLDDAEWGGTAGVTAGSNWQFGAGMIGIEADGNWTNFETEVEIGDPTYLTNTAEWDWFATVRARAGLAVDRALIYATGGIAIVDTNYFVGYVDSDTESEADGIEVGVAAGAGGEYAWTDNLSFKLEWLYIGVPGSHEENDDCDGCDQSWTSSAHILRAGLNLHF